MLKVLIAIDEPDFAMSIVKTACSILDKERSEITLLNVLETTIEEEEYFNREPQKFIGYESKKSVFSDIESFIDEKAYKHSKFLHKEGKAYDVILKTALDGAYDLIVLGSHNKHRVERFFLGSVSNHVLKHSKCSVMVVKPPFLPKIELDKSYSVLLAVDGSEYSDYAAKRLGIFVDKKRASVDVLNVTASFEEILPSDALMYTDIQKIIDESISISKELTEDASEILLNQGLRVNKKYQVVGDPASTIIEEGEKNENDLIVMGSHGTSGIADWLIGSVSYRVYEYSSIPVLIVKK